MDENEIFETEGNELDWDAYLTEGLLPVSRVHINVLKADLKDKTSRDSGEPYKQISVHYEIDLHEVLGDKYPGENKKTSKGWVNFYLRGRSAVRFRALYKGCTGQKMTPTGQNPETGRPTVNFESVVADLRGLSCYTALIWRKQDDDSYEEDLGWDFAQNLDDIRVPTNKFLQDQKEEE